MTSSIRNIFALLAICAGNSPVPGEFPAQRPVTRSFDVFFDLRLNKRLSKHSWGWWFETLPRPLWRHSNASTASWLTANDRVWKPIHHTPYLIYDWLFQIWKLKWEIALGFWNAETAVQINHRWRLIFFSNPHDKRLYIIPQMDSKWIQCIPCRH